MEQEMATDDKNNLKRLRESRMLSKAELAREAGISPLTIDRIERGMDCRMSTMRKILQALNIDLSERRVVFPNLV
jgi:predicted transcriptional regulator